MENQDLLERYRLALQLIPDPDVAGDLFMEAADEAELRRLAARWRRQHGLTPAPDPQPGPQPALTPDQVEDARHLARRGVLRRRFRRKLAGLGAALLVIALVLVGLRVPAGAGLAGEPAFARQPIGRAESDPYRAAIYRAEASPGAITIWWEMAGPGLTETTLAAPQLTLAGSGTEWLEPVAQEAAITAPGRLVARSTFNTTARRREVAVLQLQIRETGQFLLIRAPLTRIAAEPGTRELPVPAGQQEHILVRAALAPTYTLIRYATRNPAHFIRVEGPAWSLEPLGPPRVLPDGEYEAVFEPLPPESRGQLTIRLERGTDIRWYSLPANAELGGIMQDGNHVTVQMAFSTYLADPATATPLPLPAWPWTPEHAYLTLGETRPGIQYPALAVYQGEDPIRNLTLWRLEANVPPKTDARQAIVWVPRILREPLASFIIDLPTSRS